MPKHRLDEVAILITLILSERRRKGIGSKTDRNRVGRRCRKRGAVLRELYITDLTQSLVDVRRDLLSQYPILDQAGAPSTDADALIPIHPGAATYYGGNQQSFLDKYDDKLYYGSLLLGSLISIIIAAWRFAGSGIASQSMLEPLYELGNKIKHASSEAELEEIEKRIDDMLKAELARNANGEGADSADMAALSLAAHRLQYLMSHRRTTLHKSS
jgi:hypothetical protein